MTITTTAPVRHDVEPMTPAERAEVLEKFLAHYATALAHFSDVELGHEADRAETLGKSATGKKMRAMVEGEQTARRALKLLVDLGDTADAIADRLRALGIRGVQCLSNLCPLAVYLESQGITAYVSREEITVLVEGGTEVRLPVPAAIATFVQRHDGGVYLDLVDLEATNAVLSELAGGCHV